MVFPQGGEGKVFRAPVPRPPPLVGVPAHQGPTPSVGLVHRQAGLIPAPKRLTLLVPDGAPVPVRCFLPEWCRVWRHNRGPTGPDPESPVALLISSAGRKPLHWDEASIGGRTELIGMVRGPLAGPRVPHWQGGASFSRKEVGCGRVPGGRGCWGAAWGPGGSGR